MQCIIFLKRYGENLISKNIWRSQSQKQKAIGAQKYVLMLWDLNCEPNLKYSYVLKCTYLPQKIGASAIY